MGFSEDVEDCPGTLGCKTLHTVHARRALCGYDQREINMRSGGQHVSQDQGEVLRTLCSVRD